MDIYIEKGTRRVSVPEGTTLLRLDRKLDGFTVYPVVRNAYQRQSLMWQGAPVAADWRWTGDLIGVWLTHSQRGAEYRDDIVVDMDNEMMCLARCAPAE